MRSRFLVVFLLLALAAGCASHHRPFAHAILTEKGRIGRVQMDRSTRLEVIAFAGSPDVQRSGREYDGTPYLALGYGCSPKEHGHAFPVLEGRATGRTGPYCDTVYWVNRRTHRLGAFYTVSPKYSERHGVRIGMATAAAEAILRERVYVGCESNLYNGPLAIAFGGGVARKTKHSPGLRLVGGHVIAFAVNGGRSGIGIFDCL